MKKILLILSIILTISMHAASQKVNDCLFFHNCKILNRDYEEVDFLSSPDEPMGVFMILEEASQKFLVITIGDELAYDFPIALSKDVVEGKNKTKVFAGGMDFEGHTVPLQVFVCYSKYSTPDCIIVDIYDSPTIIELSKIVKF